VKKISLLAGFLLLGISILSAEVTPSDVGMIFQVKNLVLSIDSFNDGYQTGVGLKWWPKEKLAVRGLFGLDFNTNAGQTWFEIGASAGVEYHPTRSEPSPYFGGFVGGFLTSNVTTAFAFIFGGMFGAEMRVWKNVGIFAEYDLLASIDENGFTVGTEAGGGAQLGLIIYF
jgi:hypothetical protein